MTEERSEKKTLEEFLQKEWNVLCKKKKIKKPYPPINPENRAFALRLAAFVVREIRIGASFNAKCLTCKGEDKIYFVSENSIKALGVPVEE